VQKCNQCTHIAHFGAFLLSTCPNGQGLCQEFIPYLI